jgi:hypothetical protein
VKARDALLSALLVATVAAPLHAQLTTRLRGRIVDVQGAPVRDVRVRIVGHGEPEILDSGEFELQLSGRPTQVEIALIGTALEVLYPINRQVAIPVDPAVRIPIVVGKSDRAYINDMLAARFVQLGATVRQNSVRSDASLDSLSEGIREIIRRLGINETEIRESIEAQKRQADIKPDLLRTWDRYILEAKDLRDAFRLVVDFAARNRGAVMTLQTAVQEYNAAFDSLNNRRNAFQSNITSYWRGAVAEGLQRDLADVYSEAIETIHKGYVLPLNASLVVLQRAHMADKPTSQQIAGAVAEAGLAVRQLDVRIAVLEERYGRLRNALERN